MSIPDGVQHPDPIQKPTPRTPLWRRGQFSEADPDPLAGFVNIMDVMLVFALGLMIALIVQSKDLQQHFKLDKGMDISAGKELAEPPESLRQALEGNTEGMESLGQVYRDPHTGKLILIGG
jgi:hypothetical protein